MENPYLVQKREAFNALQETAKGLQTRAADENRALTTEELNSVKEQLDRAKAIASEIELLVEGEKRAKAVGEITADLTDKKEARGRATTQDRDPGFYTRTSKTSFFADQYAAREGDYEAKDRLNLHSRALDTADEGGGVIQPIWMTQEFELKARQGRALANAVSRRAAANGNTIYLPKQTAGTDAVVAQQANENDALGNTDAWDSDVDTITPKMFGGEQLISRQLFDGSTPGADLLILEDLVEVYNDKVEALVASKLITAAGTPAAFATEAAFVSGALNGVINAQVGVRTGRKRNADVIAMTPFRYGEFLKLNDTTGRPMIGGDAGQPMNVAGVGEVPVDGRIRGLGVITTDGLGTGAYPDKFLVLRPADCYLYESGLQRYTFTEVAGPQSIKVGIYAYVGVIVRQAGKGVKALSVTAAS